MAADTRDLGRKERKLKRRRQRRLPGWRALRRRVRRLRRTSPSPGPDVSSYQGAIDWDAVAEAADFALIKVSEGRTVDDPQRRRNQVAAAKTNGLLVGAYHFAHPENNTAVDEAHHAVRAARDAGFRLSSRRKGLFRRTELPLILDYETADPQNEDEAWIKKFVDTIQKLTGVKPIIYGGSTLRERTKSNFGCELWLAAYVEEISPLLLPNGWWKLGPTFWQYTDGHSPSDAAGPKSCPGIGPCDMSQYRHTRRDLLKLAT